MKTLIFDSTSLIYLSKARILEKISKLKTKNIIPSHVYQEVVEQGKNFGFVDALYIENVVKNKLFETREFKIESIFLINDNLSFADSEVLSAAKQLNATALIDESVARYIATLNGINLGGTVYILFLLLKNNIITKNEFRQILEMIINFGWRCSTELYIEILNALEKLNP